MGQLRRRTPATVAAAALEPTGLEQRELLGCTLKQLCRRRARPRETSVKLVGRCGEGSRPRQGWVWSFLSTFVRRVAVCFVNSAQMSGAVWSQRCIYLFIITPTQQSRALPSPPRGRTRAARSSHVCPGCSSTPTRTPRSRSYCPAHMCMWAAQQQPLFGPSVHTLDTYPHEESVCIQTG